MTGSAPPVSIVIPARNEEASLSAALASALAQDYPGALEIVVADGSDTPAMGEAVAKRFPAVRVIPNPDRTAPAGLNRAVRAASHAVIVRCDACCVLPPGYVRRAVATLQRTGAANVGGAPAPGGHDGVRAHGGAGAGLAARGGRCAVARGRPGGAGRHGVPGRLPSRRAGCGGRLR